MRERISVNPNIHFGKPCIAGTRITVQNVLELIKEGFAFKPIIQAYYPDLTLADIRACKGPATVTDSWLPAARHR